MAVYLSKQTLRGWAGSSTWREAECVFQSGGVRDLQIDGQHIRATVTVTGHPVHTRFELHDDGSVISNCPCYQNLRFNTVCQHVVAAGMALAEQTEDPRLERRKRILARLHSETQTGRHPVPRREPPDTIGTAKASLRLRLPETWQADWQANAITVTVQVLVDGKKHAPDRIAPDRPLAFSEHDRYLLYVVEDLAGLPACPAAITLTAGPFAQLLTEAQGGQLWISGEAHPIVVSGEPVISVLHLSLDPDTGEMLVVHHPEPEGTIVYATARHGWLYTGQALHPLESILPFSLRAAYHAILRIERSRLFYTLYRIIPPLEDHVVIEKAIPADGFTIQAGTPTFDIHIQGSSEKATAALLANYGGIRFDTATAPASEDVAPIPDQPMGYWTRHAEAEADARTRFLTAFGEDRIEDEGKIILNGSAAVIHVMADIAPAFEQLGWHIRFGEGIASFTQQALWVHPVITVSRLDADTGRLDLHYADEHDSPVHPDTVESAIRTGQAMLNDKERTLLLDITGLNALAAALAECVEQREGIACVPRIHAGFIQGIVTSYPGARLYAPDDWISHARAQQDKTGLPAAPVPGPLAQRLRPYQRDGVNWLCFLDQAGYCGILADEMGLGKTVQALAWLDIRRRSAMSPAPAIVVCPTSLLQNWAREVERFVPDLSVIIITGSDRQRLHERISHHDVIITSYALLRRDITRYDAITFSAIILDEAQHIKNRSTQNAVAAKRLKGQRRLVLTGTPIENSVNDLWSIMDFLMPGYMGTSTSFRIRFEQPIAAGSLNAERALRRLRLKMHPFMLRRLKSEVAADLPDKVTRIADCPMHPAQRRLYRQLLARYNENLSALVDEKGFERSRFSVFSALLRLRQCCCHPALLRQGVEDTSEMDSGKMDLFFELLDEAMDGGHRVLVFSQFVQMLHILREALRKRDIPFAYLDGATRDRMAQVDAFNNNPAIPVFLVSLKAGGSGLNLTGANVVIHYDPWWNPAVEDQATDRTHRIGQMRTVYNIKLVTENSIEQKVIALQQRKRELISATIGTPTSIEQSLTWEDVSELLRLPDE